MKLRLKDNTIRIRLSMPEVVTLVKDHKISSMTLFPGQSSLKTILHLDNEDHVAVSFDQGNLKIILPSKQLDQWDLNDQVGHRWEIDLDQNQQKLLLVIEKDFQCLTERPGEDESSLFPNPNESHG